MQETYVFYISLKSIIIFIVYLRGGKLKYCKNCGAEIDEDSKYCSKCGALVEDYDDNNKQNHSEIDDSN